MGTIISREHPLKTGETIRVRSAVPDDAPDVLVHGRAIIEEGEFAVTSLEEYTCNDDQERDWIREYAENPGKLMIVAESAGRIIGILFLEPGSRKRLAHTANLHMSVGNDWRSRGVGTILLQTAIVKDSI